jgi:hypothetical protein
MATQYFQHDVERGLAICKECYTAVLPINIASHLRNNQHGLTGIVARSIAEEVQSWPGLVQYSSQFEVPTLLLEPVPGLTICDGWKCVLSLKQCHYVCRTKGSITQHWRKAHNWTICNRKQGGSGVVKTHTVEERFQQAAQPVQCQRFFA